MRKSLAACIVAITLAACGQSPIPVKEASPTSAPTLDVTERSVMTTDEYVVWCSAQSAKLKDAGILSMTFGEYSKFAEGRLEELDRVDPPESLKEFHEIATSGWTGLKATSDAQRVDSPLDVSLVIDIETSMKIQSAVAELPPDLQESITEAGCFQS